MFFMMVMLKTKPQCNTIDTKCHCSLIPSLFPPTLPIPPALYFLENPTCVVKASVLNFILTHVMLPGVINVTAVTENMELSMCGSSYKWIRGYENQEGEIRKMLTAPFRKLYFSYALGRRLNNKQELEV